MKPKTFKDKCFDVGVVAVFLFTLLLELLPIALTVYLIMQIRSCGK